MSEIETIERLVIPVMVPRVTVLSALRAIRRIWNELVDLGPSCPHRNRVNVTRNYRVCWDCGRSRVLGHGFLSATWRYRETR